VGLTEAQARHRGSDSAVRRDRPGGDRWAHVVGEQAVEIVHVVAAGMAADMWVEQLAASVAGVAPGEVVLINASLQGLSVGTGVMVLYADDGSFTLMTPQGHPESGWVTFSAFEDEAAEGTIVAQVQSMARANDPIYELGFKFGGSKAQEAIWTHVLMSLAAHFESAAPVRFSKTCIDPSLQWSQAKNIWHNAAMRSMLYMLAAPARWAREPLHKV
jgi:Domain of unknown function (DUF1990)